MNRVLAIAAILLAAMTAAFAQTVPLGPRFVLPYQTVVDSTGAPIPGALLYFYASGTKTKLNTYSDPLLTVPNANPVQANAAGVFPTIFMNGNYKIVLTDSFNNQIWTADPVDGRSGNAVALEIEPGITTIVPTTNGGVLYDNNGVLGDSTTLPSGLTFGGNEYIASGYYIIAQGSGGFAVGGGNGPLISSDYQDTVTITSKYDTANFVVQSGILDAGQQTFACVNAEQGVNQERICWGYLAANSAYLITQVTAGSGSLMPIQFNGGTTPAFTLATNGTIAYSSAITSGMMFTGSTNSTLNLSSATPGNGVGILLPNNVGLSAENAAASSLVSLIFLDGSNNVDIGYPSSPINLEGETAVKSASFGLSGNIQASAWTTSGVRYANVAASYTDTSSSGTVAAAYTDLFPASTIIASSATTYTNYYGTYFKAPVAGTNVTFTHSYALGADSINATGTITASDSGTWGSGGISDGVITATSEFIGPNGSTSSASFQQTGHANTGVFFPGSQQVALVAGGTQQLTVTSAGPYASNGMLFFGDESMSSGAALVSGNSTNGGLFGGEGSSYDVTIRNSAKSAVVQIPTGTTNINVVGTANLGTSMTDYVVVSGGSSGATINTNGGSLGIGANGNTGIAFSSAGIASLYNQSTSGTIAYALCAASGANGSGGGALILSTSNCFSAVGSITIGTTTVASGTTGYLLYDNGGTLGNETISSAASGGMVIGNASTYYVEINGNAATSTINTNGGGLDIGTATLALQIASNGNISLFNQTTSGTPAYAVCAASGANGNGGGAVILDTNVTICGISAARFKNLLPGEALSPAGALAALYSLRTEPWRYRAEYQDGGARKHISLIADDVAVMNPDCVEYDEQGRVQNYDDRCIEAYLVAAIKELKAEIHH